MYLDIIVLIIIILSIIDGLKNGLFVEILSMFGLGLNFMIAKMATPLIMKNLNLETENNYFVIYVLVFWGVYIFMGVLLHYIKNIMQKQNKGIVLKIFGGLIGVLKGFIISMLIVFCFNYLSNIFYELEKYGENSKAEVAFLKLVPVIDKYTPKTFKEKIKSFKNKKMINDTLNRSF